MFGRHDQSAGVVDDTGADPSLDPVVDDLDLDDGRQQCFGDIGHRLIALGVHERIGLNLDPGIGQRRRCRGGFDERRLHLLGSGGQLVRYGFGEQPSDADT